ncbi:MAG: 4-(cytidine 5'-diphospho)-2-C-methyl-D-erythritol kinase [Pyrinomonadaceae bacterium]|nr:4-(cytidine 5'-diphospho)-2-C-methyl-D-erythritol kinase [Pyrinomonadaceae bacterium]
MSTTLFTLPSFAKINCGLRVLGKRPDGYHEIRTVLETVSLHDILQFATAPDLEISLSCDDPLIPTDQTNLIVRAAIATRARYGIRAGVRIHLEKRIPVQGGLGGGSSNGAVALLGLTHLWKVTTKVSELAELASALGSDVPFFLSGGRALGTGTGTKISSLPDIAARDLLIVAPTATVATAAAYKALSSAALTTRNSDSILAISRGSTNSSDWDQWPVSDDLENDFEQVIFDIEPEIGRVKNALLRAGARSALLAGSGSSVFGIFDNREAQQRALEQIRAESSWRIFPCATLSREEYIRAMGSCGTPLLRSLDPLSDTGA